MINIDSCFVVDVTVNFMDVESFRRGRCDFSNPVDLNRLRSVLKIWIIESKGGYPQDCYITIGTSRVAH